MLQIYKDDEPAPQTLTQCVVEFNLTTNGITVVGNSERIKHIIEFLGDRQTAFTYNASQNKITLPIINQRQQQVLQEMETHRESDESDSP